MLVKILNINNMKQLSEITDTDCRNILTCVFDNSEYTYINFTRNIYGHFDAINFNNDQDDCYINAEDSRVRLWLYCNNFDILSLLKCRENDSLIQIEVDNLMSDLLALSKGTEHIKQEYHKNFTLDNVLIKCRNIFDKYFDIHEKYEIV